jgi:hypothetical protein
MKRNDCVTKRLAHPTPSMRRCTTKHRRFGLLAVCVGTLAASLTATTPLTTAPFPPVFPLASLFPESGGDGGRGFVLTGADPSDFSGSVSAAGDINADGIDDLIVGAPGARASGTSVSGR